MLLSAQVFFLDLLLFSLRTSTFTFYIFLCSLSTSFCLFHLSLRFVIHFVSVTVFCGFCYSSGWCSNFRSSNSLFLNLLSYIFFFFLNVSNLSLCLDLFFHHFFSNQINMLSPITFEICSQHIWFTICVVPKSCIFFSKLCFSSLVRSSKIADLSKLIVCLIFFEFLQLLCD